MAAATIDRRRMLAFVGGAAVASLLPAVARASPSGAVMYRDPGCGCCMAWARKVEATLGTKLRIVDAPDLGAIKRVQAVPADLQSCHTAIIGGYTFEGHVPPDDIRRLLTARPRDLLGLAVAGMPSSSAGMESGRREPYQVIALVRGGKRRIFSFHG